MEEKPQLVEPTLSPSLGVRIHSAMADVAYLQKKGRNEAQGYKFLGEAQVKGAVNQALREHGLYIRAVYHRLVQATVDETKDGKPRAFAQVETTIQIAAVGDLGPEFAVATGIGFGGDKGGSADKAVYKAQAGALKYALTSLFLIETGDDPEKDEEGSQEPGPSQPVDMSRSAPKTATDTTEGGLLNRIVAAASVDELKSIKPDVVYLQTHDKEAFERVVASYRARGKVLEKKS